MADKVMAPEQVVDIRRTPHEIHPDEIVVLCGSHEILRKRLERADARVNRLRNIIEGLAMVFPSER